MALGDIGSVLNTFEYDTDRSSGQRIIKLSDTVVAVFYNGWTSDGGEIKTYSIATDGTIGALIDSAIFDADAPTADPDILHISGNIYAIAYRGYAVGYTTCKVATISITSAGVIGSVVDTLVVQDGSGAEDAYACIAPTIIHISGTIYAVTYHTSGTDPEWAAIETISIDDDGNNITAIDSYNMGNASYWRSLIKVTGTIYLLARSVYGSNSQLDSIVIANDGTIGAVLDNLSFGMQIDKPRIVHIANDVYLVSYYDADTDGWFKTFTCAVDGTLALIDSKEWHTLQATNHHVIYVMRDGNNVIIAISYQSSSSYRWVTTYTIGIDGTIAASAMDDQEIYDGLGSGDVDIIHLYGDIYIVVYNDTDSDGILATIGIETATVYPTDAQTRVTSIIHRYDRGIYNMEIGLGEVTTDFGIPATDTGVKKSYTPYEPEVIPTPTGAFVCSICGARFDTLSALSMHDKAMHPPMRFTPTPAPSPEAPPYRGGTEFYPAPPSFVEEVEARRPKVSPWAEITPWKEEAGETFGSEVIERVRAVRDWIGGLFR